MSLTQLPRTLRTARHLRPAQVAWRMRYRLRRQFRPKLPEVPPRLRVRDELPVVPLVASGCGDDAVFVESLEHGVFRHLHQSQELGHDEVDWRLGAQSTARLWTVTLHYHEWAFALADIVHRGGPLAERADALLRHYLERWIVDCDLGRPGARDLAWNSYAIATRIGWWCRLYDRLGVDGRADWGALEGDFRDSLWKQAAHLRDNLEFDLLGNHILRDAVGLVWAGRFFASEESSDWLRAGTELGRSQVREQVLADGGHFERSPMYHLHAMEDVLVLAHLVDDDAVRVELAETWDRMAGFLAVMRHPDGGIPLLNDAALNGACDPEQMLSVGAAALGLEPKSTPRGARVFSAFGVAVWHGARTSVFFDGGEIGPDCQSGHAHADSLTVELSVDGARLFVDPGTLRYDAGADRDYDRSTAAHNTVSLDGANSSETWHIFRVGRRARPHRLRHSATANSFQVRAGHDGYRLATHVREVCISRDESIRITDRIESRRRHAIRGGFLLDPAWEIVAGAADGWTLRRGTSLVRVAVQGPVDAILSVETREYHPEFGRRLPTQRLCWAVGSASSCEVVVTVHPI